MHTLELDDIKKRLLKAVQKKLDSLPAKTMEQLTIQRAETPAANIDSLAWLNGQDFHSKIFWARRNKKQEVAGVGAVHHLIAESLDVLHSIRRYLHGSHPAIRYFGGMRFDVKQKIEHHWLPYARYRFVVPQLELTSRAEGQSLAVNFFVQPGEDMAALYQKLAAIVEKLALPQELPGNGLPTMLEQVETPDRAGWAKMMNAALAAIEQNELEKIVLAGNRVLTFTGEINPFHLLKHILKKNGNSFHFGFQFQKGVNFIGMTPECLYQRQGEQIYTEAIAGTRRRGGSTTEDERLADELLNSDKDLREHRWVKKMIVDRLSPLCKQIEPTSNEQLLTLSHVLHLHSQFSGILRQDVTDEDVIKALHPTPAVGGYPKKASVERIARLEAFDRGWYAAPVGWVGRNAAEFAVAIRSALVTGETLRIFAGSGIVSGSDAEAEWEEKRTKEQNFLQLFQDE